MRASALRRVVAFVAPRAVHDRLEAVHCRLDSGAGEQVARQEPDALLVPTGPPLTLLGRITEPKNARFES